MTSIPKGLIWKYSDRIAAVCAVIAISVPFIIGIVLRLTDISWLVVSFLIAMGATITGLLLILWKPEYNEIRNGFPEGII